MLTAPARLTPAALAAVLSDGWGLSAVRSSYLPVGFGGHHWDVTGAAGRRWFVTADDLAARRQRDAEPLTEVFGRLRAALGVAASVRAHGCPFVVAPAADAAGQPLRRAGEDFSVAVYPYVTGHSYAWGPFSSEEHRLAVLRLLADLHRVPPGVAPTARTDDFALPCRSLLDAALAASPAWPDVLGGVAGPCARPAAELISGSAVLPALLARYDLLAARARAEGGRRVLTHGEPHPGNTLRADDGRWLLVDWDAALLAPPERDLWLLDPHPALSVSVTALRVTVLSLDLAVRWPPTRTPLA